MPVVTKSVFVKGQTDYQGRLHFTVDDHYANLAEGLWRVKAVTAIFEIPRIRDQWHDERPISLSGNFCYPPQFGEGPETRAPLKLAIGLVKGFEGEFVSLPTEGSEFISFRHPPGLLHLLLKDESLEEDKAPIKNTKLIVNLVLAQDD
jgi:hypothetical protein